VCLHISRKVRCVIAHFRSVPRPLRWPSCTLTRLVESEAHASSYIAEGEVRNSTLPLSATAMRWPSCILTRLVESEARASSYLAEGGVRTSTLPLNATAVAMAGLHSDTPRGIGSACVFACLLRSTSPDPQPMAIPCGWLWHAVALAGALLEVITTRSRACSSRASWCGLRCTKRRGLKNNKLHLDGGFPR
jgi:hypothetical protein